MTGPYIGKRCLEAALKVLPLLYVSARGCMIWGLFDVSYNSLLEQQSLFSNIYIYLIFFFAEVDNVGQGHIQLAQILREEAKKMEDFREKQKLHRKKVRRSGNMLLHRRVSILPW